MYRTEKDIVGEMQVPAEALFGIHSMRARENFPSDIPFHIEWYRSVGITKSACYSTYRKFRDAAVSRFGKTQPFRIIGDEILGALSSAAADVAEGKYFDNFIVPAVQGGAGTSINMNINEIIANLALIKTGNRPGRYDLIDPIEHANIFQSTNDVVPTALAVAVIKLLQQLEDTINHLRGRMEEMEKESRDKLRPGYTQMQEAVPSSFGLLYSAYNDALSRDWWRVSKCFERARQVNLGGGATGTGIAVPRFFIMEVVPELRKISGVPVAHSENLSDTTSNLDKWVEVHSILKAHAVNLEKMAGDLRLLASDLTRYQLLTLPARQTGSSIMPGKINPVIPEFVISASHKVYSNDQLVSSLCGQGTLDLNAYLPVIGHSLIESIRLLTGSGNSLHDNLLADLITAKSAGYDALMGSPSVTTALVPFIGYKKASEIAVLMKQDGIDIFEANKRLRIIKEERLRKILEPGNLLKLGFSLDELKENE
ncbi:MAG TPA: lyase family protein [Bacteroidales bacterium]|nr:lyase family protein [Bacteroidales bacterium]